MNRTEPNKSNFEAYLMASVVVVLLFVLPAISYYYLDSGMDYRVDVQDDLKSQEVFKNINLLNDADTIYSMEILSDKISLINVNGAISSKEKLNFERIVAEFKDRVNFQGLDFSTASGFGEIVLDYSPLGELSYTSDLLLVNDSLHIIHRYGLAESDLKLIVRHLASLLAVPERPKIHLKRDLKNENDG